MLKSPPLQKLGWFLYITHLFALYYFLKSHIMRAVAAFGDSTSGCLASPQLIKVTELQLLDVIVALVPFREFQSRYPKWRRRGSRSEESAELLSFFFFYTFGVRKWIYLHSLLLYGAMEVLKFTIMYHNSLIWLLNGGTCSLLHERTGKRCEKKHSRIKNEYLLSVTLYDWTQTNTQVSCMASMIHLGFVWPL